MAPFKIDIDQEKVLCEGEWLGTTALVDRIRRMIETGDYRISAAAGALEHLQKTLAEVTEIRVRFLPEELNRIEQNALQAGITVGALLRRAAQGYIAAEPGFDLTMAPEDNQAVDNMVNDLIIPGGEEQPPPITHLPNQPISIPSVDAALPVPLGSAPPNSAWTSSSNGETVFQSRPASHNGPRIEDAWFKKG